MLLTEINTTLTSDYLMDSDSNLPPNFTKYWLENDTRSNLSYVNITKELPLSYAIPLYGYLMPILLIITMVANTLIVVVLSQRHMRTPTNVVLMVMAVCDMLTLLMPAPLLIYMYTFGNHYKPLTPVLFCYIWTLTQETLPNFFHTASIWLTLVLAVQRYIYVCHAPLARRFCTKPIVYKCVVYTLVVSALHQVPKTVDSDYHLVEIIWNNQTVDVCDKTVAPWVQNIITVNVYYTIYFLFRVVFVHLLPCIALVVLNLLLFQALKQAQKRRDILLSANKKTPKAECRKMRESNCTTLMLIVVVTVFLIVEIPLAVVTLLHVISSLTTEFLDYDMANTLILFSNFFIILSYPINFAIYCGMSRQFRETFKELFITGSTSARNGSSRYSIVNGPRTCTNETVL